MSEQRLDPSSKARLPRRGFIAALVIVVLIEPLVALHPHFEIEHVFGFHAWYPLLACAAMIAAAAALGGLLQRPDDYYERRGDGPPSAP